MPMQSSAIPHNRKTAKKATPTGVLVRVALATALIMVATLVSVPVMFGGYIHLGDVMILLACVYLSWWAIPAASIGSAFADMILGVSVWAPGTLVIKAVKL